jgi:hypothetical protein
MDGKCVFAFEIIIFYSTKIMENLTQVRQCAGRYVVYECTFTALLFDFVVEVEFVWR